MVQRLDIGGRLGTLLLLLAACIPLARAGDRLAAGKAAGTLPSTLQALAERARPGVLGVVVLDAQSGERWGVNADHAFPMMSVFKAPVAATVLARVERGELGLAQVIAVRDDEVQAGPVRQASAGRAIRLTVRELLAAAVSQSDNTAANVLVRLAGGPAAVTAFLRSHGIEGMRVDLDEADLRHIFEQTPAAHETAAQEDRRLHRGYRAFLADPRNRSTPDAAATFLLKLWRGELLPPGPTAHLLDLMAAQVRPSRLRAGLPPGALLADKCGTSYTLEGLTAAYNDVGIVHWPDGRAVIVAGFLSASTASEQARRNLYVELAGEVARALRQAPAAARP